jgi:erythromycin esterase-like protein
VNRYVHGRGDDTDAVEALDSFKRFPTWMWRNTDAVEFVAWLREHNEQLSTGRNGNILDPSLLWAVWMHSGH